MRAGVRLGLAVVLLVGGALAQDQAPYTQPAYPQQDAQGEQGQQQDPPDRVARVSFLQGDVSLQPASANGDAPFAAAEVNYTVTAGDRVYTGQGGMTELESDNLALRLGKLTDVTLLNFSQAYVQLGVAAGSVRVRTYALGQAGSMEIDTSNGTFTVLEAGDVRVSSYPGGGQRPDTTIVTVNAGRVQAVSNELNTVIESGQVLRIDGQGQAQLVQMLPEDELDQFDQQRDEQRAAAAGEIRDQYVNPGMVGYDDLTAYGDWAPEPEYGQVWYPRGVEVGWSPYHNGHWAYIAPWGYTWVEAEPWGFAPFHYGRWAQFGGRWGWIAGPPVVRPVYSPALVAFVGAPGVSVTAWFPLGPREPFVPWYRASPGYVNRVNVSNIYNRNVVEVRNVYVNRTTNVYVNANVNYVNRGAVVAVPQAAFAQGRPVREAQVRVDARQMQAAQVMTRPPEVVGRVGPSVGMGTGLAPARALPPAQARPVFQGRAGAPQQGNMQQGMRPQGQPAAVIAPQQTSPARIPGGLRPPNPGNANPELIPNQQRPAQTQQPARVPQQDRAQPVGGGRNMRPLDQPLRTDQPSRTDQPLRTDQPQRAPPASAPVTAPAPPPQRVPQQGQPQQRQLAPPPQPKAAPAAQQPAPRKQAPPPSKQEPPK